jgi:hypothetical protein
MSTKIIFRGILDTSFDNFLCLRGFARIGDLADASESDESYQRPLIAQNKDDLKTYLEKGESKFFPEVILSTYFDAEGSSEKVHEFLQRQATKPQALKSIQRNSNSNYLLAITQQSLATCVRVTS